MDCVLFTQPILGQMLKPLYQIIGEGGIHPNLVDCTGVMPIPSLKSIMYPLVFKKFNVVFNSNH
jgi:hypothetical protein